MIKKSFSHIKPLDYAKYAKNQVSSGLGDQVERVAQPIARVIDKVARTRIAECGGCKKRRDWLNRKFPGKSKHIKKEDRVMALGLNNDRIFSEQDEEALLAPLRVNPGSGSAGTANGQPAQVAPAPVPPSPAAKAVNLARAAGRVAHAALSGQDVRVSSEERERRLGICRSCDYWREDGNAGFGECQHEKCGCTRFKHGLATEDCPLDKWESATTPKT